MVDQSLAALNTHRAVIDANIRLSIINDVRIVGRLCVSVYHTCESVVVAEHLLAKAMGLRT